MTKITLQTLVPDREGGLKALGAPLQFQGWTMALPPVDEREAVLGGSVVIRRTYRLAISLPDSPLADKLLKSDPVSSFYRVQVPDADPEARISGVYLSFRLTKKDGGCYLLLHRVEAV